MSEIGRAAGPAGPSPRMRAGTTDRQAAVDRLSTHFADGRLDATEFDQRVATAYSSTYLDELTPLFADLPQARPQHPSWAAGPPGPAWSGPSAGGRGAGRRNGRRTGPPPHVRLGLIVLLIFTVIWSIGAVGHGFFPVPLLWLVIVLLMVGRMRHRRWSGPGRR